MPEPGSYLYDVHAITMCYGKLYGLCSSIIKTTITDRGHQNCEGLFNHSKKYIETFIHIKTTNNRGQVEFFSSPGGCYA